MKNTIWEEMAIREASAWMNSAQFLKPEAYQLVAGG
jgi:hypothetical protein